MVLVYMQHLSCDVIIKEFVHKSQLVVVKVKNCDCYINIKDCLRTLTPL